jgi:small conductance mechanosensitive channel
MSEFLQKAFEIFMTKRIFGTIMVILVASILVNICNKIISKILIFGKTSFEVKRRKTIVKLFQSIFKYIIWAFALLTILGFYGVNTKSLIASFGVLGAVLGLALQDTIKDFISGVSLVLENYLQVGDTVTYNDFTGEVIELGLRTTKIKKPSGEVLIVANRNIDSIINLSQKKASIYLEIDTAYEEKTEKVEKVLKDVIAKAIKDNLILKESEYIGINELGSSSIKYMIMAYCDQTKRYPVKREMLKRIKLAYEENNIKIPYNQIEVHHGEDI